MQQSLERCIATSKAFHKRRAERCPRVGAARGLRGRQGCCVCSLSPGGGRPWPPASPAPPPRGGPEPAAGPWVPRLVWARSRDETPTPQGNSVPSRTPSPLRPSSALGPLGWEPLRPVLTHTISSSRHPAPGQASGRVDTQTCAVTRHRRRPAARRTPGSTHPFCWEPRGPGRRGPAQQDSSHGRGRWEVTCGHGLWTRHSPRGPLSKRPVGTGTHILRAAISIPNPNVPHEDPLPPAL